MPNPTAQGREDLHAAAKPDDAAGGHSSLATGYSHLPNVEEGDEEALSYSSSRSRHLSRAGGSYGGAVDSATPRSQQTGGTRGGNAQRTGNGDAGSNRDIANRAEQSEAGTSQPESSPHRKKKRNALSRMRTSTDVPVPTKEEHHGSPLRTQR